MNNSNKLQNALLTPYTFYFIYGITGIVLLFILKDSLAEYGINYTVIVMNTIYILFYTSLVYLVYSLGHNIFAWFIAIYPVITLIITLLVVIFNIKNGKETVILKGPEIIVNKNKVSQTLSTYLHSKTAFDAWLRIIAVFL